MNELKRKGVVERKEGRIGYLVNSYSKPIKVNWNWTPTTKAILTDNRSPEKFDEPVRTAFDNPREYGSLLRSVGRNRQTVYDQNKIIFAKT